MPATEMCTRAPHTCHREWMCRRKQNVLSRIDNGAQWWKRSKNGFEPAKGIRTCEGGSNLWPKIAIKSINTSVEHILCIFFLSRIQWYYVAKRQTITWLPVEFIFTPITTTHGPWQLWTQLTSQVIVTELGDLRALYYAMMDICIDDLPWRRLNSNTTNIKIGFYRRGDNDRRIWHQHSTQ